MQVTPEAFLLDATGALVYRGAVGGTNGPGLHAALTAFLDGRPVEPDRGAGEGNADWPGASSHEADDPFGSVAFSSELIFEKIPDVPAHHCSTIAEAANGDLLVVWYGGSYESADDQVLFLSRRKQGGRVWSKPEVLIRDSVQPPGNAVVFRAGGKRLFIVWARMEASRPLRRGGGWGQTRLFIARRRITASPGAKTNCFSAACSKVCATCRSRWQRRTAPSVGPQFRGHQDRGQTWEQLGAVTGGSQPTVLNAPMARC